jgi:hypothetical protein
MDIYTYLIEDALILVPVLLILGQLIKEVDFIPDKFIPLILLPFGILGSVFTAGFSTGSIIQGILVTGAAVYGNQLVKQLRKDE